MPADSNLGEFAACKADQLQHRYRATFTMTSIRSEGSGHDDLVSTKERSFGFNVIGYLSGNLGLGVSARNIASLLLSHGVPIAVLDMNPRTGRGNHNLQFEEFKVASPERLPYIVNLVVLGLHSLPDFFLRPPWVLGSKGSSRPGHSYWNSSGQLNVVVFWWELSVLPRRFLAALQMFDVVLGPSPFLSAVLQNHLSNVPTVSLTHPFQVPDGVYGDRAHHGLPQDAILFVTSFEPSSITERKNPVAVVDAFQKAFRGRSGVRLIIKLNNAAPVQDNCEVLRSLKARCDADTRIRMIDTTLSYQNVLRLYASCDVFVSLHRSEGLGFGLMEAMALGKPVIATGWSGNMAFMDHTNSCLVGYRLVPVPEELPVYGRRDLGEAAIWAEPDVECAAAWMKKLADDPSFRMELGARAADSMASFQERAREGKFIRELEAIWRNSSFLPGPRNLAKARKLAVLEESVAERFESTLPRRARWVRRVTRAVRRSLPAKAGNQ